MIPTVNVWLKVLLGIKHPHSEVRRKHTQIDGVEVHWWGQQGWKKTLESIETSVSESWLFNSTKTQEGSRQKHDN